jgi:hypothetical protein
MPLPFGALPTDFNELAGELFFYGLSDPRIP